MKILAHRGLWLKPEERNTREAFEKALAAGFGLETDVRDHDGALVIAHDPPRGDGLMPLATLLDLYVDAGEPEGLAINIKADGLQSALALALSEARVTNAFVFDMSTPDTLGYLKLGLPVFTRQSEYELQPPLYDRSAGIWLDCFERDWIDGAAIAAHLDAGKQVALVSPELHGRPHDAAWAKWAGSSLPGVSICTDFPREAREFFR